jgi:hypothetical protein
MLSADSSRFSHRGHGLPLFPMRRCPTKTQAGLRTRSGSCAFSGTVPLGAAGIPGMRATSPFFASAAHRRWEVGRSDTRSRDMHNALSWRVVQFHLMGEGELPMGSHLPEILTASGVAQSRSGSPQPRSSVCPPLSASVRRRRKGRAPRDWQAVSACHRVIGRLQWGVSPRGARHIGSMPCPTCSTSRQ